MPFRNGILSRCSPDTLKRLRLRPLDLPAETHLQNAGEPIAQVTFPEAGCASVTSLFSNGSQVELALIGWEGALGIEVLLGTRRALHPTYMQLPGHGHVSSVEDALAEFRRGAEFHDLILTFVEAQFLRSAQSAGCNACHSLEQRLARWLLLCSDRSDSPTLPLKHEFLASMLCVTRSSVSLVAAELQRRGLIHYSRGILRIEDRQGLQETACECYTSLRNFLHDPANRTLTTEVDRAPQAD